jgi:hypothetical protein
VAGEALFVGWGQVVRGREQLSLQVFQEAIAFYTKLQEEGRIASFDATLLGAHGGDLAGFLVMHGEQSSLDSIAASEEFIRLVSRAGSVVDNIGVVPAYTGEALGRLMGMFGEIAQELPQAK